MSSPNHAQVKSPFTKKSPVRGEYQPPAHLAEKISDPSQADAAASLKKFDEAAGSPTFATSVPKSEMKIEVKSSALPVSQPTVTPPTVTHLAAPGYDMEQIANILAAKGLSITEQKVQWRKFSIETKEETAVLFDEMAKVLGMRKKLAYEEMFSDFIKKYKADFEKIKSIRTK